MDGLRALHSSSVRNLLRLLLVFLPALLILTSLNVAVQGIPFRRAAVCLPADNVGGLVYHDRNLNGVRDGAENGVEGITVAAYDPAGAVLGTTATITDGTYVLTVTNGTNVRVEFIGFPAGFLSGPFGPDSSTTVTFLASPNCAVDLGISNPAYFCQDNPDLATSCYVFGTQVGITDPVLISFPYNAGSNTTNPPDYGLYDQPPPTHHADAFQIGSTYGLAYQRSTQNLLAAAFMKRHSGFGPGGTGAIYKIDMTLPITDPNKAVVFADLNALFGADTAGADPHPVGTNFEADPASWDAVGKISLGDIDLSENEETLYAINLWDRRLYVIDIGAPPSPPALADITRFDVPLPGDCLVAGTNIRPFGLGVRGDQVYVGLVCTAETTQNLANLRAYVYSFDPGTSAFTQVLNFPLNYPRTCSVRTFGGNCNAMAAQADWQAWTPVFATINTPFSTSIYREFVYPQPWLTDIVFDDDGDMILGFRDRYGDQTGFLKRSPDPADNNLYSGDGAGDMLRACWNGTGWDLENNGLCGGIGPGTAPGTGTGPGSPGGEYYYQENYPLHDETIVAGLALVPFKGEVVSTIYDPIFDRNEFFQGGIRWFNNTTGTRVKSYRVFQTSVAVSPTYGKANGLGDLEAMCLAAPLEIGNRVWLDKDDITRDGIQDASITISSTRQELPIPNVTVHLYLNNTLIATDVTDANGEYIFNAANVPGGLKPFTTYVVRLDNPADYDVGGSLYGLALTLNDQGTNDAIDSDGVPGPDGRPEIVLTTRNYVDDDHTYDFGFYRSPTAVELLYFRVESVNGPQVTLGWATESEIDNFGFNLYRAPLNDFSRAALVHFEPSAVGGTGGAVYEYADSVPSDGVWWYWLADVDTQGRETRHGPVSAQVGPDILLPVRAYLPIINR